MFHLLGSLFVGITSFIMLPIFWVKSLMGIPVEITKAKNYNAKKAYDRKVINNANLARELLGGVSVKDRARNKLFVEWYIHHNEMALEELLDYDQKAVQKFKEEYYKRKENS